MIKWHEIAAIPEEFKDGREVLLWLHGAGGFPALGSFSGEASGWFVDDNPSVVRDTITHAAEITAP